MQGRSWVLVVQSWKDLQQRIPREGARVAVVMVKEDKVGAAAANPRPWGLRSHRSALHNDIVEKA
jgi:hypothetical protein